MATFANAFNKVTSKTLTENQAVVEKTTGSLVLDFSHKVVRNTSQDDIKTRITEIMNHIAKSNNVNDLHDLFVLMFHKRNPRGGEGEKALVYQMFLELYEYYPETTAKLVHLLADFGYYKDFYLIWENIYNKVIQELQTVNNNTQIVTAQKFYSKKYGPLIKEIVKYTIQQRNSDLDTLTNNGKNISLIGKWIPRENSHFGQKVFWFIVHNDTVYIKPVLDMLVLELASQSGVTLDPGRPIPTFWYKKYRTGNTTLNKKLDIPEIKMCANQYSDIKFEQVASRAMLKYRKAFMNEKLKEKMKPFEEDTGNRFPNVADRVNARKNYKALLDSNASEKLKSAGLEPHDITNKLMTTSNLSSTDKQALYALWEAKKLDVKKHLSEMLDKLKADGVDIGSKPRPGNLIPMVDVSESMTFVNNPRPLDVAISLGIMTAELHEENSPFRDMIMSFTDIPKFYKFNKETSLIDRITQMNSYKGYNTNFKLAMEELLVMCIQNKVSEEDIPDLLVFTDGQFDAWGPRSRYTSIQSEGHWVTHHQQLLKMWHKAGYSKVPRMIYWNLRGDTPGFQTDLYHPGVQLLQGFSPNLIKFVLYGEAFQQKEQEVEVDGKIVKMKVCNVTPWDTFRGIIDQSRYDIVRVVLNDSDEKLLKNYSFVLGTESTTPVEDELNNTVIVGSTEPIEDKLKNTVIIGNTEKTIIDDSYEIVD